MELRMPYGTAGWFSPHLWHRNPAMLGSENMFLLCSSCSGILGALCDGRLRKIWYSGRPWTLYLEDSAEEGA